jgi:methionyl-tRNA formyltransferase
VLKVYATAKTGKTTSEPVGTLVVEKNKLFVATADNLLELKEIQLAGKKRMEASVFLNGFRDLDKYQLK